MLNFECDFYNTTNKRNGREKLLPGGSIHQLSEGIRKILRRITKN